MDLSPETFARFIGCLGLRGPCETGLCTQSPDLTAAVPGCLFLHIMMFPEMLLKKSLVHTSKTKFSNSFVFTISNISISMMKGFFIFYF